MSFRFVTRMQLRQIEGLYYIALQEDFYHPEVCGFVSIMSTEFIVVYRTLLRFSYLHLRHLFVCHLL